jgi:predicted  nucleic acid-binding Zn-ribbon protein
MAELEQARLKIVETEDHWNSLSLGYAKLEKECESLRNAVESLKQEKTEVVAAHEAEVTAIRMRFQDYRVRHRKKLHDFQINLERAVNEFGVRCHPYPEKKQHHR